MPACLCLNKWDIYMLSERGEVKFTEVAVACDFQMHKTLTTLLQHSNLHYTSNAPFTMK